LNLYFDLGLRVIAADLDPQANLTAAFLDEDRLEEIWEGIDTGCFSVR
jgi:chromosome partitioning protein